MKSQEWREEALKDVCESVIDCVNKTAPVVNYPTPYKMIRTTNVKSGVVSLDSVRYVEKETFDKWTRRSVPQPGDVILTREAPLGEVGMMPANSENVFLGQRLMQYRANPEKLNPHFLLYSFQEEFMQGQIKAAGSGSTVEHMRVGDAEDLKIRLPEIDVQNDIAGILSAYDFLIENNNRRIAILENMAQSLYREWFVNFRFPGHENCKFVDSVLGKVPEGWGKQFGDIVDYCRDSIKKAQLNDEMIYLGLEHMPRKSIAISEWGSASQITSDKCAFQSGDILFGKIRPYFHKVGVALTDGVCSTDIFVWRPKSGEYAAMAAMTAFSDAFVAQATQTSQGTKMPRANWDVLKEYPVFIPSGKILDDFNDFVGNAIREIGVLALKNRNLKEQRDILLPRLVSGQIVIQ